MGGVFLAEDLSLKFHGVGFALTGLGTYFAKYSQGDALVLTHILIKSGEFLEL